jgi:hypothetical protein
MTDKVSNERLAEMLKAFRPPAARFSHQEHCPERDLVSVLTELLSLRNAQSEAVARWMVEEHTPSGAVSWQVVEHEHHARLIASKLDNPNTVSPLYTHPAPQSEAMAVKALDIADDNDGIEQDAFEAWAKAERYDMHEHPMHWLFLDAKTSAARDGWRAGIRHSHARIRSALTHRAPPLAVTDEMVERARATYAAKVMEYDRDFERDDKPAGLWERKYGTNLHATSLGEAWAMRAALTAALEAK